MLLAIDTSVGSSVAIVDGERVLAERSVDDSRRHAELVGDLMRQCLVEAGVSSRGLDAVAVGMGPGPFTGLRVGIAAANSFAFGLGLPVLRVVSHDAVALEHLRAQPGPLLVTTDARRRERYWSTYAGVDAAGLPVRLSGPAVAPGTGLDEAVTDYESYVRLDAERVPAGWLGKLAAGIRLHDREFAAPEPLYLRSADAAVPGSRKRVTERRLPEQRLAT
ncbi:MAG: tRNA (adenosine(37)-N6)-threonylcarbamoyltransferase complex dimerization subunit type 1 TsaB [Cryobacterium sp.]|nr:tRNA (adenosine(37)-N6)-threonylcarbamoyltransferase complex dimerization subunit type 1 TsaB [Cryobacterium sp.]